MIMEKANRVKPYKSASPADTVCKIRSILHNYDIFVIETSQKKGSDHGCLQYADYFG